MPDVQSKSSSLNISLNREEILNILDEFGCYHRVRISLKTFFNGSVKLLPFRSSTSVTYYTTIVLVVQCGIRSCVCSSMLLFVLLFTLLVLSVPLFLRKGSVLFLSFPAFE